MREQKLGTTGLTQKEAIFQTIKSVVGDLIQPDVPLRKLILDPNVHTHGKTRRHSNPLDKFDIFDEVVDAVFEGLTNGFIPTKTRKNSNEYFDYASRIVYYWLKNDPRLNGGIPASKRNKKVSIQTKLKLPLITTDSQLRELNKLLKTVKDEDHFEIKYHILIRKVELMFEALDIDESSIQAEFLPELEPYFASKRKIVA